MLDYAAKTDIGTQRDNNEDAFLVKAEEGLWVLADGVGGFDAGEVASKIACQSVVDCIVQGQSAAEAIQSAHQSILAAPSKGLGTVGMASTIIVLLVHGNSYQISWVGDSRAYLWSPNDSVSPLTQISKDQSLVQKLLDEKVITAAEAINHPRKNLVLQALGQVGLAALEVDSISGKFCDGQQLLLCSDGLNDYVSEADITALLKADVSVDTKVDSLVDLALKNMGKDNITVILVDLNQDNLHTTQQVEQVVVPARKANIIASNQRSQNPLMAMLIPVTVILLLLGIWFLS